MQLDSIEIKNFRNFLKQNFKFNSKLTIIYGKNSIGKTNLLESIYFALKGYGFREKKEEELINENHIETDIKIFLTSVSDNKELRILLQKNGESIIKNYLVNRIKKISREYSKNSYPVVIFSPNLIFVIDGDTSERRDFIDKIISSFDIVYKKRLANYETGLRKRNKILEIENNIEKLNLQLKFWDKFLIENADYITKKRYEFVDFLNSNPKIDTKHLNIKYEPKIISETTLKETFQKQLYVKRTLVGPQRDTYEIFINNKNVHKYGSRSEQRLGLFWIILNEIKLYENTLKIKPIILLDDIFSELDIDNKKIILNLIKDHQTIMTTTEKEIIKEVNHEHEIISL